DIHAEVDLLAYDLGDRAAHPGFVRLPVCALAALAGADHRQQIGRPREAADVGREDPVDAAFHGTILPIAFHSGNRAHPAMNPHKIDIFNHVMPARYLELVRQHSKEPGIVRRMSSLRMLWDIEARVAMLREKFADVRQVLTLALPPPELLGGADVSPEFAQVANDGMAEMCAKWPQEFPAFVASLPMNNVPAALDEMDRAIGKLGARG